MRQINQNQHAITQEGPQTTFEVVLMNKRTFEGKRVMVQATSPESAFKRAKSCQQIQSLWAPLTAKVYTAQTSKFSHKGLRSR